MNRAQPYQHGFDECKKAVLELIDKTIAEIEAEPMMNAEADLTTRAALIVIRKLIEEKIS